MSIPSRREFLKFGAALPVACHTLDARGNNKSDARPPKRILFVCNSLGFYGPNYFPAVQGDLSTSKYLREMTVNGKLTVFQNLFHPGMETSNHDSEKSFLTGASKPEAPNFVNTVSVDQVLAQHMGHDTRYPFLAMSIYDRGWGCSWNQRGDAIPPMHDETQIFDMLFRPDDLDSKREQLHRDQLIIRSLRRDMEQLQQRGDSSKLDVYRAVLAELERNFQREQFWLETDKPNVPNTLSDDRQFAFSTKIKNLLELAKLAFQTDSTRVITLTLDWVYGAIQVPGATGGWHTLSHHGGNADLLERLSRVEIDIVRSLNQFIMDLDAIPERNGTLLDSTTVVIGSNFGDSSNHTCNNLPTMVAGGNLRHDLHRVLDRPTPLCNLWLELLNYHGVDVGRFGSSTANQKLVSP